MVSLLNERKWRSLQRTHKKLQGSRICRLTVANVLKIFVSLLSSDLDGTRTFAGSKLNESHQETCSKKSN